MPLISLLNSFVAKRANVLRVFRIFWTILGISFLFAVKAHLWFSQKEFVFWHQIAIYCGKTALIFFIIALSPGIFKRFGIRNRLLGIIVVFRRQFGDTMFLLALFHGTIVGILDAIQAGHPFSYPLFEWFGITSVVLLFFLFITSNNYSQARLGKNWFLLHRLVYVIMWLVLFHLALQSFNKWTILALLLVIAEMAGIIYSNRQKKINPNRN